MGVESIEPKTPPFVIVKVPPWSSESSIRFSLALVARSASWPRSRRSSSGRRCGGRARGGPGRWTPRRRCRRNPRSRARRPRCGCSLSGYSWRAFTAALTKKDMKPSFALYLAWKSSPNALRIRMSSSMSTSLKVVRWAASCPACTRRRAIVLRIIERGLRVTPGAGAAVGAGAAFGARGAAVGAGAATSPARARRSARGGRRGAGGPRDGGAAGAAVGATGAVAPGAAPRRRWRRSPGLSSPRLPRRAVSPACRRRGKARSCSPSRTRARRALRPCGRTRLPS